MNHLSLGSGYSNHSQSGAVLIVGLIMVLLMTIVGLAAIRGTGMQETMAGNMRERNIAFQAAEAGLRAGEDAASNPALQPDDFTGADGLYRDLGLPENNPFDAPLREWTVDQWQSRAINSNLNLGGGVESPRFLMERMNFMAQQAAELTGSAIDLGSLDAAGLEIDFYRVSARAESPSGTSDAVIQSTYRAR